MTLRITVQDLETGDTDHDTIEAGDYMLVTHFPCQRTSVETLNDGETHVITVTGRIVE